MSSTLTLRLPLSLHQTIKKQAKSEGISINQFLVTAASEKISALMTQDYLAKEAARGNYNDFLKVLHNVPHDEPEEYDKLQDC